LIDCSADSTENKWYSETGRTLSGIFDSLNNRNTGSPALVKVNFIFLGELIMKNVKKDDLKRIVDLSESVPDKYREKCFELLLKSALGQVEALAPDKRKESKVDESQSSSNNEFIMPIDVKAFLNQYSIDESLIWEAFLIEGRDIRSIYKLNETKKAKAQIKLALLISLENALIDGNFKFDVELLRTRCQEFKCYDSANFMSVLKKNKGLFKDFKSDEPLVLSPDGKSELADILEQIKD